MAESAPTVFVVDDDILVRESLVRLAQSVGLHAEAFADASEFLETITPDDPGCAVIDVRLPGVSGLELQRELIGRDIQTPVIVTTGYGDVPTAVEAMKAGAFDFIEKPIPMQRMLTAIQKAIAQDRRVRRRLAEHEGVRRRLSMLSQRERQVADLVVGGMASSDIALKLGIQPKTVEVYRSHVNKKMRARNAADLVRMLYAVSDVMLGDGPLRERR
jgi:FixJ family two-component response regulator